MRKPIAKAYEKDPTELTLDKNAEAERAEPRDGTDAFGEDVRPGVLLDLKVHLKSFKSFKFFDLKQRMYRPARCPLSSPVVVAECMPGC